MEEIYKIINNDELYDKYEFIINPKPKIRTSQSDKWWKSNLSNPKNPRYQRAKKIKEYYQYTGDLRKISLENGFVMDDRCILVFFIKFPKSYSRKKRNSLLENNKHKVKPDWDNLAKGFQDAIAKNDSHIHCGIVFKRWTDGQPKIIAYKKKSQKVN